MPLDFVITNFQDTPATTAIQRFLIDMPTVPKKLCLIRQIDVIPFQLSRVLNFDINYGMSVDPDHTIVSMVTPDSTMFLTGGLHRAQITAIGFAIVTYFEGIFRYPEGIECPYTRLPFFIQHSNTGNFFIDWTVRVFYEYVTMTAQEIATAVLRRGRAVTRD